MANADAHLVLHAIQGLVSMNAVEWSHVYMDASLQRLKSFLSRIHDLFDSPLAP